MSGVYLITGAGSGMGQLAARRALQAGASVAALDVNSAGLDQLGEHERLLKLTVDITDFSAVKAAVDRIENELGPLTRVVNAAAIMPYGLVLEQDNATLHRIMDINYGGLANMAHACLPNMVARSSGEFVSFSSLAGHMPTIYVGAYNASKFAVNALTEVLYHENRNSGVRFVCVCPPVVDTPLLNQARNTVWPKVFKLFPPINPDQVLDKIENALLKRQFWVFPTFRTRLFYWTRCWFPSLGWWVVHHFERR